MLLIGLASLVMLAAGAGPESYPYDGPEFARLVADSYRACAAGDPGGFHLWMNNTYRASNHRVPGKETLSLEEILQTRRDELSRITDPSERTQAEAWLSAWLHRLIKVTMPRFSLERGFEFCHAAGRGERQCFLQAVLIASMLQSAGIDAGVVMVYKNPSGQLTNNGHAVTLVKLIDGADAVIDASEPEPYGHPRGLFVMLRGFRYVHPIYDGDRITHYTSPTGDRRFAAASARPLDLGFVRSQFQYYRGERAPDALVSESRTREGLKASEKALRESVRLCPENPLAVYMLGRTRLAQGDAREAARLLARARGLYSRFGWLPVGVTDHLTVARQPALAH